MKPTPSDDPKATGPESMTFTLHGTPAPMRDYPAAQSRRGRITMLVILFACALPVLASYFTYYVVRPSGHSNYATLIDPQRPLPSLDQVPAQDLDGHSVPLTTLKGQWLMIVVAPAGCGKLCESNLYLQRQLREMMGAERDRIQKVWLVDSPGPIAPALADAMAAKPTVATYRVERAALARWLEPERRHQLEEHLYIVDPLGNWMMRTPANPDPVKLKADVDKLLRASAWWNRAKGAQ
ncbi:MAG TPA: hypothetical protein VH328_07150 [Burkholderiaceae bacterium]|nr:hypothetical protein [Burkholderiaceae bacterium]